MDFVGFLVIHPTKSVHQFHSITQYFVLCHKTSAQLSREHYHPMLSIVQYAPELRQVKKGHLVRVLYATKLRRVLTGDVIDHNRNRGVPDVGRDEGAETLLAGGIPQLKAHCTVFQVHGLRQEIDADCCLCMET